MGAELADFSKGHELYRAGDFAGARREYGKAMTNQEPAVRSIGQLAIAQSYEKEGKLREAIREYAKVGREGPAHHREEAGRRIQELQRRSRGLPERNPMASRVRIRPIPKAEISLHVAPDGSDKNEGTAEAPFATLERARDEVRKQRQKKADAAVEVVVHGGEYEVREPFRLQGHDSGTANAPIVYRAAAGEKPRFRGGVKLTGFEPVKNAALRERLPAGARDRVVQVDLKKAGVKDFLPLKRGGFGSGRGFSSHPNHEVFWNGKALQLARGPNEGWLKIKDVVVDDGTKGYDRRGSKIGKFYYEGDRPTRWKSEPDLLLYGYWFWDWSDSYEQVEEIDVEKGIITVEKPYHRYGFSIGARFYAINAVSELDEPGEWYIDRKSGVLLVYPPSDVTEATVEMSGYKGMMMQIHNVKHVRFEGLTWELGSADAIQVSAGEGILFAGCTVRHFAGSGVEINGGTGHGLLSCDIYSLGRGGTVVNGGNRKTLTPGRHFVENCEIYEVGRIDHTYTPAVQLSGVGNRIAHNRFHDMPSSAMRVAGNEHVVEFNEIHDVVLESDDQGGVDMYGNPTFRGNVYRFNYLHHIGAWDSTKEQPKGGHAGIRLDDAICQTLVYGNIFERCSAGKIGFGGVQINGGKENIVDNNLFIACTTAMSFSPWSDERWKKGIADALESKEIDRELYLKRYPGLATLQENANRNYIWRNRTSQVKELFRRASNRLERIDNWAVECCEPSDDIPGFYRIPHEEIGLYEDQFRKTVKR